MDDIRKQEIKDILIDIKENYNSGEEEEEEEENLTMFKLVSLYNNEYENPELIGGKWIRENISELENLE